MGRFSKLETQPKPSDEKKPAELGQLTQESAPPRETPVDQADFYDAATCVARGDVAFYGGDDKDALRWYARGVKADATLPAPWIAQVRLLILTNQPNEAKVWLIRAFSVFPNSSAMLGLKALLDARMGRLSNAIGSSDVMMAKNGEDPETWLVRGHILTIAESKNADFCFDQCMDLTDAMDWKMPMSIGLSLDSERKWAKSIKFYEAALERRSSLPFAWYRIGRARAEVGQRDAAAQAFARAEDLCGDNETLRRKILSTGTGSFLRRVKMLFKRK